MEFDYVIVGAGSAGCVLASRLSEDPAVTVALLETGGARPQRAHATAPAGVVAMVPTRINNYAYETVPQPGRTAAAAAAQPRGKTLGGSSSISAMLCVRGHRRLRPGRVSATKAGHATVLPYFRKAESNEQFGASPLHGQGSPLNVTLPRSPSPINQAFLAAAAATACRRDERTAYNNGEPFGSFI
ncbi:MAG: GMC family oxidoreductase N-terminal domain-containing protein [Rubrivivax sp.]